MLKLTSPAFSAEEKIPPQYTCDGEDIPPLLIEGVTPKAKSLALIVDDPDAPMGLWNHWVVWNIAPNTKEILENGIPKGAIAGTNSSGTTSYHGPCPPFGTHRYFFKIFALDMMLDILPGSKRDDLLEAMQGHILDEVELLGRYGRVG